MQFPDLTESELEALEARVTAVLQERVGGTLEVTSGGTFNHEVRADGPMGIFTIDLFANARRQKIIFLAQLLGIPLS